MANTGSVDFSRLENSAGMDQITTSSRTRASTTLPLGVNWIDGAGTPVSTIPGATVTVTGANLLTGIITYAPSVANTATIDTAANIVAAVNGATAGAVVGDYISALIVNGSSANAITLAAGTGGTFDTNQATRAIPVNTSKWVIIRLTNVIGGSEAYTIYF